MSEHIFWQDDSGLYKREEIVRCRDCAFFVAGCSTVDHLGNVIATGDLCDWTELWVKPDGYCKWAERRQS